ncbi:MAG: 2TM domain-containing protein [Maribacter sp.]|nr:2TM domain-containing protein [Maribacter sp.]NNK17709.1 2TM domain-containing protein [Maribacter sp.]
MEVRENNNREKLERAKKRVEELKGFYIHLTIYILVNTFISTIQIMDNIRDGESFNDAIWNFGTFAVWFFWGIGLFSHGVKVYSLIPFFGKDWERKQIQKYMDKDKKEAEKYR